MILGSIGFFIYGMKIMSDGIQLAAGAQLREILRSMTRNKYLGVFTGFLITALVQSSSATTVMTVSFVNAGLLSLVESAGVMMGANIGTTITGWIISVLGFKVKMSMLSIPIFTFAIPMLFSSRDKLKHWGEFLIGFAILFLGLDFLKASVPDLSADHGLLSSFQSLANFGILSRIIFVLIGTLITIIVQSSSAAMAITLTVCSMGWLPFDVAAAMILGENIGTTITAEIASLVANVNAKRSARVHSLFNIIGVVWMVLLLPYFLHALQWVLSQAFGIFDGYTNPDNMPIALSAFHTAFNLMNVILLLPFTNKLVDLAKLSVPSKGNDKQTRLQYIGGSVRNPELAIVELQKETANFGEIILRMASTVKELVGSKKKNEQKNLLKKIKKYENITDDIEVEINEYITELNKQEISETTSRRLSNYLNISNDIERIADIYYQISKSLESKIKNQQYFLPEQRNGVYDMLQAVEDSIHEMYENLSNNNPSDVVIDRAITLEKTTNKIRNKLRNQNYTRLGEELYDVRTAILYMNIVTRLERIGDHALNISEALVMEN